MHRTTIEDVAIYAGVSTATVSRVINRTGQVSANTAKRVQMAIEVLDYIPSGAARDLARRRTNIIGLVIPSTITSYYADLLRGIDKSISEYNYSLLIYVHHPPQDPNEVTPLMLGEHNTDGLIVFTSSLSDELIGRMHQRRFPMALLYRSPPENCNIPAIKLDNRRGMSSLLQHIIVDCGHRRIAYLRGPIHNEDSIEREASFREVMRQHDMPIDEALIGNGNFVAEIAEPVVASWLKEGLEFDAIIASDDHMAIGAMTALRRAGKRIPQDVAVVGFNDDPIARHLSPALTTVRAQTDRVGYAAATQLIRQIHGEVTERVIRLPTELIIRQSCGYQSTKQ